jgi:dimethylamine/trimethylamine dehydrogenase
MVSAIRRGVLDLIGAARPSIADPYLPTKLKENRPEDIRECIGCNICVTGDTRYVPLRCTQNPSMGEEWRRGWHPETIAPKKSDSQIMVVGAGPAGLECARALGQRGYAVTLVEASREPGGRVIREAVLPGLSEWRRVVDWRLTQIKKLPQVSIYPSSPMSAADILEAGIENIILATGATYRRDGLGRNLFSPIPGHDLPQVYTPDDLLREPGRMPGGRVLIYDDDHYYMAGVLAEMLAQNGCAVSLVTPAPMVSYWTQFTLEQERIEKRLLGMGVNLITRHTLACIQPGLVKLSGSLTNDQIELECDTVVLVTDRISNDGLFHELAPALADGRLRSLSRIGDAEAPNIIAQAVFSGHLAARNFDEIVALDETPFKVERGGLA